MVKQFTKKIRPVAGVLVGILSFSLFAEQSTTGWNYQWQKAELVESVPVLPVAADVIAGAEQQQIIALPFPVVVNQMLVQSGQQVKVGQPIFVLGGPEILSLSSRLEIAHHHAEAASERITKNSKRFELGDITQEMWLEWQHQAHQTELELSALKQQQESLQRWKVKSGGSGITFFAPTDGSISFSSDFVPGHQFNASAALASIANSAGLQLEFELPLNVQPKEVKVFECQLAITWQSQQISKQRRTWRTEPLPANCQGVIGQKLIVQPLMSAKAYKISRNSLVQTENADGVIVDPHKPMLVDVQVLAREGNWVYVQGDLAEKSVATADVAALKGQLMGLGASE